VMKRIPLDRLRDVSKQRSIRRPGWSHAPGERIADDGRKTVRLRRIVSSSAAPAARAGE
jgi:hypothetical protein